MGAQGALAGRAHWLLGIDSRQFTSGLRNAQLKVNGFASAMSAVGAIATLRIGAGILAPFIREAAEAEAVALRFTEVFGDNAGAMNDWADGFSAAMRRSSVEVKNFTAQTASVLEQSLIPRGPGFDALTKGVTRLGADLSAFIPGTTDAQAYQAITKAINGENEALKAFHINLSEANLRDKLHSLGLQDSANQATQYQKALGRLLLIFEASDRQQGYAERSAHTLTQAYKALAGSAKELQGILGRQLGRVMGPLVANIADMAKGMSKWADENQRLLESWTDLVVKLTVGLALMIGLSAVVNTFAATFGFVAAAVTRVAKVALFASVAWQGLISSLVVGGIGGGLALTVGGQIAIVVAGVVGLLAVFGKLEDVLSVVWSGLQRIGEVGGRSFKLLTDSWQGVVDSIANSDLQAAMEIMISSLKLATSTFLVELEVLYSDWQTFLKSFWQDIGEQQLKRYSSILLGGSAAEQLEKARMARMDKIQQAGDKRNEGIRAKLREQAIAHEALLKAAADKAAARRGASNSAKEYEDAIKAAQDLLRAAVGNASEAAGGTFRGGLASRIFGDVNNTKIKTILAEIRDAVVITSKKKPALPLWQGGAP